MTHEIDEDSWYIYGLRVKKNIDLWYIHGLMVFTNTHGIDNTHDIDLDSWYRNCTPESHMHKRAKCYPYAGFCQFDKLMNI